jgi:hypothetical protein
MFVVTEEKHSKSNRLLKSILIKIKRLSRKNSRLSESEKTQKLLKKKGLEKSIKNTVIVDNLEKTTKELNNESSISEIKIEKLLKRKSIPFLNKTQYEKLRIGMYYEEIVEILGKPTKKNTSTEILPTERKTIFLNANDSGVIKGYLFCYWDRPEARYFLTIKDDKLASIYKIEPK